MVDRVVFGQQHTQSIQVVCRGLGRFANGRHVLRREDLDERIDQGRLVDWLYEESVDASVFGFAAYLLSPEGGDNDDGRHALERSVCANPAGGFYSVESRHAPIQQYHVERAARIGALNCVDGFRARCHLFYFGANGS